MPLSMRKQARRAKQAIAKGNEEERKRHLAVGLLKQGKSLRSVAVQCSLSVTTVWRIQKCIKDSDNMLLAKILNPKDYKRGRRTAWTSTEAQMVNQRLCFAAQNGFAVGVEGLRTVLGKIVADGRGGYSKGIPSMDAIRTYRALNRDITYRNGENKDITRLKGENHEHVKSLADALYKLQERRPGILDDPELIWNMDETHIDGEFGERKKKYGSSKTNHGGFTATQKHSAKHLTATIVSSASGRVAPPFFIAAGKNVMTSWLKPLCKASFSDGNGNPHWLASPKWMLPETVIRCTEKGSMTMDVLSVFIKHFNRYVRQFVPQEKHVLLFLDGHASRKGVEWIELCLESNIEVIILPANTTHFLQPCDKLVNQTFQSAARKTRDTLMGMSLTNTQSMAFKLKLGTAGHNAISPDVVRKSFTVTGLWPMDFRFLDKFPKNDQVEKKVENVSGERAVRPGVQVRRNDEETLREVRKLLSSSSVAPVALQKVSILLKERQTVNDILMGIKPTPRARSDENHSKEVAYCGAKAEYVTVEEALQQKKDEISKKEMEMREKEKAKQRRVLEKAEALKAKQAAKAQLKEDRKRRASEKAAERAAKRRQRQEGRLARKTSAIGTSSTPESANTMRNVDGSSRNAASILLRLGESQ